MPVLAPNESSTRLNPSSRPRIAGCTSLAGASKAGVHGTSAKNKYSLAVAATAGLYLALTSMVWILSPGAESSPSGTPVSTHPCCPIAGACVSKSSECTTWLCRDADGYTRGEKPSLFGIPTKHGVGLSDDTLEYGTLQTSKL